MSIINIFELNKLSSRLEDIVTIERTVGPIWLLNAKKYP